MNDWVCGNCKSINRGSANSCYSCGGSREIVAASETRPLGAPVYNAPAAVTPMTANPSIATGTPTLAAADGQSAAATATLPAAGGMAGFAGITGSVASEPAKPATAKDLAGGLGAGLVAAVLASAIWYAVVTISQYQLGIVAIVVGFLVGQAVVLGASRRGSPVLIAISVVLTLLALVVSEYLIVVHFVNQELAAEGAYIDVIQPPGLMAEAVVASLTDAPITLLFWAIALFQAFTIPARLLGRSRA